MPLLVALVLLGCSPAPTIMPPAIEAPHQSAHAAEPPKAIVPQGKTREVSPREKQSIEELMQSAQRVRGLRFAHDVPVLVQDAAAIMAYVETQIDANELERSRVVYVALGLLSQELDVRSLLVQLMGEQIVGYYDVDKGHLVVRDDVMRAFGGLRTGAPVDLDEARVVLVHELVHALQDQRLGLSTRMKEKRDSDSDSAFRALIEGDATLAMIAYSLERESVPLSEITSDPARVRSLSEFVRSSPLAGSQLDSAPAIVRVPLLSAYVDGLTFAANLHGDGGFSRINRLHADPPLSMEQVMHPERYVHRDAPEQVRLPDAAAALGPGFPLWHQDTLGELELRIYFSQGSSDTLAAAAAEGWGGDRLYAFRAPAGEAAIVWLSVWDGERDASEAETAAARVLSAAPRPTDFVVRSGTALLIARGVAVPLQKGLRERFAQWASARVPSKGQTN
jgi:hypothetical protein